MASVASQVILHPAVSRSIKFASTTVGRDKTYRGVQYFARFFAWYLLTKGHKLDAARWNALKSHLGTARKLMRLGKPIEHLQSALRASLANGPAFEQIFAIGRQLGYFGYLCYDALIWANTIKFISVDSVAAKRFSKRSSQLWLAGILFSLAGGVLKTIRLARESSKLQGSSCGEKDISEENQREVRLSAVKAAQGAARRQFIVDILDVWIPATGAGIANVNDGALGIIGLITSLLGAQAQWKSVNGK
ncbi:Peroxisomal membrane protein PMP27 [Termitomyces sp. T112]|nr:Peroxisomal membrane protein PMP27 [Termitomyces sp. T112]